MIGDLWSTGITVEWQQGWVGFLMFMDRGFAVPENSVTGVLRSEAALRLDEARRPEAETPAAADEPRLAGQLASRYYQNDLERMLDNLRADAEQLGISWFRPTLYYLASALTPTECDLIQMQATRLGWLASPL